MVESVKNPKDLALTEALKSGRLQDFIALQEADNLPPVSINKFNKTIKAAVTAHPPQGRTSGSRARDGSSGKKTR